MIPNLTRSAPRAGRRRSLAIGGVVVLASVLAACGDDDDEASDTTAAATADDPEATDAPETTAAAPTTEAAAPTTEASSHEGTHDATMTGLITVNAVDYAFEDLPATVPAGTQLAFFNKSEKELHELVVVPLPPEETRSLEELLQLPEEELPPLEPVMVALAAPGQEGMFVVGDGTIAEPGRYGVVCFIPTGADPDEFLAAAAESSSGPPEVEGGPPHVAQGMFAELIVE